jgi:hypothetical protein
MLFVQDTGDDTFAGHQDDFSSDVAAVVHAHVHASPALSERRDGRGERSDSPAATAFIPVLIANIPSVGTPTYMVLAHTS